ncbi:carbohydrate ABC transporter permease [Proteiniclasticum ruminis]|uniref:N-acetylglucosamine transport system permease protein n=1 Tax=Proteiniclasticum ruminis TaxID=398199 RepID=A0A1G8MC19_9CLOT|nr:sugar ABC transporter permease [Proteiniclasticum ruminis]SDI65453.1 N-acetylglucosamine transport system permease protein [Proteiniclasticum ruminis]
MKDRAKKRFIAACIAPALILVLVFMAYPTLNVFIMSLYKWGGLSRNKTFVGLNNFLLLTKDTNFIRSLQNTLMIIVLVTMVTLSVAMIFASILVREKIKGQNFFRIVFYIPNILSVVVISSIFSAIYDPSMGLLNGLFRSIRGEGFQNIQWLGNQKIVLYAIIVAMIWQAVGYYMVMYMASMSSIPVHLYEAADIEGAGKVKQFFSITLPLVWDTVRTTLTFYVISSINLSFLFVKVMTSGGPDGASNVILNYMYNQAYTNSSYGYGMSIGVVIFLFSFLLSLLVNKLTKREQYQY